MKAYYNGLITDYCSLSIPILDRSVFFGDAIYEVILTYKGIPYQFDEHFQRLKNNCDKALMPDIPKKEAILKAAGSVMENKCGEFGSLYIQISRNSPFRSHSRTNHGTNLLIIHSPTNTPLLNKPIHLRTESDPRYNYCNLKTTNLFPAVISSTRAAELKFDETLYLKEGIITECSHSAFIIQSGNCFYTHPLDSCVLPSISCLNVKSTVEKLGFLFEYKKFSISDLMNCETAFTSSTTTLLSFVRSIDRTIRFEDKLDLYKSIKESLLSDVVSACV